jgi:hypothetical protein
MHHALSYAAPERMSAAWSILVVYGLGGVAALTALVLAVTRLVHHLRREAEDSAAEHQKPVLQQGHAVVRGVVDLEDPAAEVVRIRIEEQGREWRTKNGWQHEWKETGRTVEAHPFHLVLDGGERLRVEPDERVFLVDALSTVEDAGTTRTRQAALAHGEHVTIVGRLVWGRDKERGGGAVYRDGGASLSLQAARGQRMLISAEPLAARHTRWVRFYAATVALLAIAVGVVNVGLGDFHRLRLGGQRVSLPVETEGTYTTRYKGHDTTHYRIAGLYQPAPPQAAQRLVTDVNEATFASAGREGTHAPFVVWPDDPEIHQIGYAPAIDRGVGMMMGVGAVLAMFLFWWIHRNTMPWYEQERVVERGSGPLRP